MSETEKKVVLVVDDAPANIRVVNEILHNTYKVRIATNGAKALELAAETPGPDLILLDVIMPGMDGYEVCARLKADPTTRDIPVIFLTGQIETTDESKIRRQSFCRPQGELYALMRQKHCQCKSVSQRANALGRPASQECEGAGSLFTGSH